MATFESDYIDILHLLHDIHIVSSCTSQKSKPFRAIRYYLNQIHFVNQRLIFDSDVELIQFIKQTVYTIKKKQVPAAIEQPHPPINWLSVFYNDAFTDLSDRLSVISPILALYKRRKTVANDKKFHAIQIIRKYIPYSSPIKGIENNNYLSLNMEHLFGAFETLNMDHLSMDLCKQIVSYLDLPTFFKCSLINHCWLNFIYRNNTFHVMLKQCVNTESMKCVIVDHSSLNRMECAHLSKIFINWQLRSNSVYLDFITLRKSWIEHYIDPHSIQLTLQQYQNESERWIALKTMKHSPRKLFDSMDVFGCILDKADDMYRLQIHVASPFDWVFYTQPRALNPFAWHQKYHSNQMGIDTEQEFWFEYYVELLHSMIDGDISQALATVMEAAQRMKFDHPFVMKHLLNPSIMRQLIRLLKHNDWRIQHNASILLANLFTSKDCMARDQYLQLATFGIHGYSVVDVALKSIYAILRHGSFNLQDGEYRVCRSLICVVGNYAICKHEKDTWKKIVLAHPIQYVSFMMRVLNQEATLIAAQKTMNETMDLNKWSFRAMALWSLSTFYRHRTEDATVSNILNAVVSRDMIVLFLNWSVMVGKQYLINDNLMHQKMNKFFNKQNKTQPQFEKEQRCFSTVLAESCIGIHRIYGAKYRQLETVLDMNIAHQLADQVLDICIQCITSDWAQYLLHLSLKLIGHTLRMHGGFTKQYIELKLSDKLNSILHIIKQTLPNEKSLVSSFRKWIKNKTNATDSAKDPRKIQSFIELYDDVLDIVNSLTQYTELIGLTDVILDILCFYAQRKAYEEQYIQHAIAYLWNSLTHHPAIYKKIITKHKSFIKLLNHWETNTQSNESVFNDVVLNLCAVLNDTSLFAKTFPQHYVDAEDEKENDAQMNDCVCPCGQTLRLLAAQDCYENSPWLYCDLCFQKMSGTVKVYHCDKKEPQHKNGYDLCMCCVKKRELINSTKYRK
eukprot:115253_1